MAEQNVPAQPPTRTDEQIVPRSQWLTIGKSNLLFNAQKIQKNPIFQISVDILKNTNFFQALTASANVPAIYLQQFWKTMSYNEKTGVYSCQLDEQWFDLSADLLRKALTITPERTSAVDKPRHPVLQCCGESSPKLMLIMQSYEGRVYSKGSRPFSHTKQSTKPVLKNPTKNETSSPYPLGTIFQSNNLLLGKNKHPSRPDFCCSSHWRLIMS
ncbi:hypothetical protein Tco_1509656 [Tanacetum coccineum]